MFFTKRKTVELGHECLEKMIDDLIEPMTMVNDLRDFKKKYRQDMQYPIDHLDRAVKKINKVYLTLVYKRLKDKKLDDIDRFNKARWIDFTGFKCPEGVFTD